MTTTSARQSSRVNHRKRKLARVISWIVAWLLLFSVGLAATKINVQNTPPPKGLLYTPPAGVPSSPPKGDASAQTSPEPSVTSDPFNASPAPDPADTSAAPTASPDSAEAAPGASSSPSSGGVYDASSKSSGNWRSRVERYADITISSDEMFELACVVFLEASTQSMDGQQAVAEVILNRVIAENFPNTIHDVLYEDVDEPSQQFTTAPYIIGAEPNPEQYEAIELALYGPSLLPADVVYFSKGGENDYVWGTIDDHVFCYQYPWA